MLDHRPSNGPRDPGPPEALPTRGSPPPREEPGGTRAAAAEAFPVYLVERERALRIALSRDLTAAGFEVRPFAALRDFVAAHQELEAGCVILDLAALPAGCPPADPSAADCPTDGWPTILLFDRLTVEDSVRAVRLGAADLLQRPVPLESLVAALGRAGPRVRQQRSRLASLRARHAIQRLSAREREVLDGLAQGRSNKDIARHLHLSPRTVEMHRARLHRKLGASSVAEILALAWRAVAADEG
jgi:two-component system response regulator FixJ